MTTRNFKYYFLIIFLQTFNVLSQDEDFRAKHSVYAEILGTGGTFSLNYDRVIEDYKNTFTNISVGMGYFPGVNGSKPIIGIPATFNVTIGQNSHHIEFGLGLSFNSGIFQTYSYDFITIGPNETPVNNGSVDAHPSLWSTGRIGYKYQKKRGGFFFKIGFTPIVYIYSFTTPTPNRFIPLAGIGAGWCIKN